MTKITIGVDQGIRNYFIPLTAVFERGAEEYPSIIVDSRVMAGAPCIAGTRIPVYGVLDVISEHGTLESVIEEYPVLTPEQVKDAINFAKFVLEFPLYTTCKGGEGQ